MKLKPIAQEALRRIAHTLLAESPPFLAAGMRNPLWDTGRAIERRFRLYGCLDAFVDGLWTAQVHEKAQTALEAIPHDWADSQAWAEVYRSILSRKHQFPA